MKTNILALMLMAMFAVVGCSEAEKAADAVKEEAGSAVGGGTMTDSLEDAKDAAGEAVEGAKEAAGDAVEGAKEAAGDAVEGAKEAVGDAADKVKEAVGK